MAVKIDTAWFSIPPQRSPHFSPIQNGSCSLQSNKGCRKTPLGVRWPALSAQLYSCAYVGGKRKFVPALFLKLRRSRRLWPRWLSIASSDTRGASEGPCVARVSLQLWLAVRNEQAKAEKLEKVAEKPLFRHAEAALCKAAKARSASKMGWLSFQYARATLRTCFNSSLEVMGEMVNSSTCIPGTGRT